MVVCQLNSLLNVNYQTARTVPTTDRTESRPSVAGAANEGPLLIIGASARSCAQSAYRSGRKFLAVDLFGDWDTQQWGPCQQIDSFDSVDWDLWLDSLPVAPRRFIVSGGMEKRPRLIARLAERITFVGTQPAQIERTNDPHVLAAVCLDHGIQFPESRSRTQIIEGYENEWIVKPFASAGGSGIRYWSVLDAGQIEPVGNGDKYVQRFVAGRSFSSLFCANGESATLIGTTVQLVGEAAFTMRPFQYCGSIGPVNCCPQQHELGRIGNVLAREFELLGVFGIDWILDAADRIWLIEINPRITASAEIFELAGLQPGIVELHLQSARNPSAFGLGDRSGCFGKAILFSNHASAVTVDQPLLDVLIDQYTRGNGPTLADIPCLGTLISPGGPMLTVFARGGCESEVRSALRVRAIEVANMAGLRR